MVAYNAARLSLASFLPLILIFPLIATAVKHQDFKTCEQSGFCTRQRAYADLVDKSATDNTTQHYSFVPKSLVMDESNGRIAAQLMGLEPTDVFTVEFNFLQSGAIRMRINERDPLHPRYTGAAAFALVSDDPASIKDKTDQNSHSSGHADPQLMSTSFVSVIATKDEWRVKFGSDPTKHNVLSLYANPFRFEIAVNNIPAITFNERGYLHLEQYRTKDNPNAIPRFAKKASPSPPVANDEPLSENQTHNVEPVPELDSATAEINSLKDKFVESMWEETFSGNTDSKPRGPASIGVDISFPGSSHVYGIPEHAASFSLKTTRGEGKEFSQPYRLYNLDVFEHELDSPMALYGSIPFLMSHKKGLSAAVLFLNSAEMWVDVEKTKGTGSKFQLSNYVPFMTKQTSATSVETHWMAESGVLDLFIFLGPTQEDIFDSYSKLTGRPTMPQQFAVSYHQSRWNYNNEDDVKTVDAEFDKHDIPYDVLWLDIEHTDGKRYFTWDSAKFSTPKEMQKNLAFKERKMVTIIDPHIKKDSNYYVSKEALDQGLFIRDAQGNVFDGHCWPGNSNWIDYTDPAGRAFWKSKFAFENYKGSTPSLYTWNDMNEPSVFNGPEITMPKDNLHHDGWEHRDVHNIYGLLFQQSTYEGQLARADGKDRPFVLSRAFFSGTQRFGAIWTGDNTASWDHLAASVPMILSIGISGIPFAGADVGGFFGSPGPELFTRWYQVGALQPFFRGHAHIDSKRREPWLFGEPYTTIVRDAIRRRYRLLPYIYTLFSQASRSGNPVMRSMMQEFPDDETTFAMDDQFLLGSAIMVKPVTSIEQPRTDIYLPKSANWYNYNTFSPVTSNSNGIFTMDTPLEVIPMFLRGGSIVPRRDRVRRSSSLSKADPYTLIVALDKSGAATGTLYVDDGRSYAFQKGEYIFNTFVFKQGKLTSTSSRLQAVSMADLSDDGLESLGMRIERIILVGAATSPEKVVANGVQADFKVTSMGGVFMVVVKNPKIAVGHAWTVEFA
ncbi:hypothetical protein BDV3_000470 [Batrachochytrium dendrobatidis]|nr:glucosidase II [Batrachochytrium dendrobatidis]KAK5665225.1 glucosidase II [Batrachochytrium dendrobatidis]